jgi:hypothetical protein
LASARQKIIAGAADTDQREKRKQKGGCADSPRPGTPNGFLAEALSVLDEGRSELGELPLEASTFRGRVIALPST